MTTATRLNRKLALKIAQDVLAQLAVNRYKATSGTYCELADAGVINDFDASFKDAFKQNAQIKCNVCALGSLFTSFVNIENQLTVSEVVEQDFNHMIDLLRGVFSTREIMLMEYVFERGRYGQLAENNTYNSEHEWDGDTVPNLARVTRLINESNTRQYRTHLNDEYAIFTLGELRRAIAYGSKYEDAEERLRVIMLNVIRNNGKFKLPLRVR